MTKLSRILLFAVGGALVIWFGIVAYDLRGGLFGECSNEARGDAASPTRGVIAKVIERNCGATTDFVTLVTLPVSESDATPKDSAVVVLEGRCKVDLSWGGDTLLIVRPSAPCSLFRSDSSWRGVRLVIERS